MVIGLKKNVCQNPNVARALQRIGGIKSLRLINQEMHILSLSIKHHGVIVIKCMSIFARQDVRLNGCEIT